jgi:hypothetical protein
MNRLQPFPRRHLRSPRGGRKVRPWLELLEERNLLTAPPTNVLVNNTAEDGANRTQSETSIVVVPTTSSPTVVIGFNDSEEYNGGATNHFTSWAQSTNGGASFTDEGALPASTQGDVGDPVLARDNTSGAIYLSTIPFSGNGVQVFRSTDNGASFAAPVDAASHVSGPDKPWITVDNASGKGQGTVYTTFTSFSSTTSIVFTKSTDAGSTWSKPVTIASGTVQGSNPIVGTDHSVYVFWLNGGFGSPASIEVRKSTNGGKKFGPAITVASLTTTGINGDLGLGGGFRTNSFPQAAVNPANGNLYVVFDDVGRAAGDKADVYFTESTNGGASWSTPVKINDDTTTNDQWFPAIAVTPDGSHVGVFWYDRRLDPANSLIDRFGSIGTVSGSTVTFGANFRVTSQSYPVVIGNDPNVVSTYMGDYDTAAADNTNFYTSWEDNRLAATAQDVFYATVPISTFAGPAAAVVTANPSNSLVGALIDATGEVTGLPAAAPESAALGRAAAGAFTTADGASLAALLGLSAGTPAIPTRPDAMLPASAAASFGTAQVDQVSLISRMMAQGLTIIGSQQDAPAAPDGGQDVVQQKDPLFSLGELADLGG